MPYLWWLLLMQSDPLLWHRYPQLHNCDNVLAGWSSTSGESFQLSKPPETPVELTHIVVSRVALINKPRTWIKQSLTSQMSCHDDRTYCGTECHLVVGWTRLCLAVCTVSAHLLRYTLLNSLAAQCMDPLHEVPATALVSRHHVHRFVYSWKSAELMVCILTFISSIDCC